MPVLAYCTLLAASPIQLPEAGVRGGALQPLDQAELRVVYSDLDIEPEWTRDDAVQFHGVLRSLLDQADVLPFRFPTVLPDDEALRDYLRKAAPELLAGLQRIAGAVQMEVRIATTQPSASRKDGAPSGAEYLRARGAELKTLEAAAEQARAALQEVAREWKQRETPAGLRLFALVGRSHIAEFQHRAANLEMTEGVAVLVSGPWPASEFVEINSKFKMQNAKLQAGETNDPV